MKTQIKFKNGALDVLRSRLLKDLNKEHMALCYATTIELDHLRIITIHDIVFPKKKDYLKQSSHTLEISKDFLNENLVALDERVDVDTLVHVHTHPFDNGKPVFSKIDDNDEITLRKYLHSKEPSLHLASIVLSQKFYEARYWSFADEKVTSYQATIKTQKLGENMKNLDTSENTKLMNAIYDRSIRALGQDNLKTMMTGQTVTVVGAGGIGSIIAENLLHMGFQSISLIDHDIVELSNLNRLVGATYKDALENRKKVITLKRHLEEINPEARIEAYDYDVLSKKEDEVLATSDWIFICTDNYRSVQRIQTLAFKYYVPFISAASDIDVRGRFPTFRGEVILVRMGDNLCLECTNRIDKNELAKETIDDLEIRDSLIEKGYVRGMDIKDPAVKTLNAMVANIATNVLVNQYTERQKDQYITMYENTIEPLIYEDENSIRRRHKNCQICGV